MNSASPRKLDYRADYQPSTPHCLIVSANKKTYCCRCRIVVSRTCHSVPITSQSCEERGPMARDLPHVQAALHFTLILLARVLQQQTSRMDGTFAVRVRESAEVMRYNISAAVRSYRLGLRLAMHSGVHKSLSVFFLFCSPCSAVARTRSLDVVMIGVMHLLLEESAKETCLYQANSRPSRVL